MTNPFFYYIHLFYLWILSLLRKREQQDIQQPITLQKKTQNYISNKKDAFLKHFDHAEIKHLSSNVDPEFYNPKTLPSYLQNPDNLIEPAWKSRKLIEATPQGTIVMHYDAYKQGFSYYSDIHGVSYSLLNAVAMKYVILFRCLHFFVDDEITPEEHRSPLIEDDITVKLSKPCMKVLKRIEKETEKEYSRNRFIRLGRVSNCNILQIPQKTNVLNNFSSNYTRDLFQETALQKQVMSYSDFKKKQK